MGLFFTNQQINNGPPLNTVTLLTQVTRPADSALGCQLDRADFSGVLEQKQQELKTGPQEEPLDNTWTRLAVTISPQNAPVIFHSRVKQGPQAQNTFQPTVQHAVLPIRCCSTCGGAEIVTLTHGTGYRPYRGPHGRPNSSQPCLGTT